MEITDALRRRFEAKVERTASGCHAWKGATRGAGYGAIKIDGKVTDAHRAAYRLYVGEIPDGLLVMHCCDNRNCVNPDHLKLGNSHDNAQDAADKLRMGGSGKRLTYGQAEDIRHSYQLGNITISKLAEQYGVGDETVRKIIVLETYTDPSIDRRPANREPLTDGQLATIRGEYAAGISRRQLSRKYSIPPTTLQRLLK